VQYGADALVDASILLAWRVSLSDRRSGNPHPARTAVYHPVSPGGVNLAATRATLVDRHPRSGHAMCCDLAHSGSQRRA
jgi:hypothetical protein